MELLCSISTSSQGVVKLGYINITRHRFEVAPVSDLFFGAECFQSFGAARIPGKPKKPPHWAGAYV